MNKPDGAVDQAAIAESVLRQLLALGHAIRLANHCDSHIPYLADMAIQVAEEWANHFEEQCELLMALYEDPSEGAG
ncbi:hypothetical protein ACNQFN_10950 [Thauera butanivorans]|uniref:hypothetical protein n=1 Tax=Thauera butanivorans TaxID=86174 RepID=UPI003AB29D32